MRDNEFGEQNVDNVDISAAVAEYHALESELSRKSWISAVSVDELEKAEVKTEEFSLSDFLHGMSNDQKQAGLHLKHLGVVWKHLTVEGLGAEAHTIPTAISGLIKYLQFWKLLGFQSKNSTKVILRNISGFCKEGEMLLLLGRPGAGCTTLLKIIANMRDSFTSVKGDVNYGGYNHKKFAKHFRGQTCYNPEEDLHYPTLTTKQTLQFALRTKTPGTRLPNETKKEFVEKIIHLLGNMLGLSKQMNVMVGNHSIRGLSGGERKRLSIAEQMTTQSTINCWDCSTRGLDAASALDYVRSLRIMTDVFQKTTLATLYQASNNIFGLFDKVILLDDGYCIYFGPVAQAKAYFEELGFYCPPRKSTPDFLTGVCNPIEREIKPGYEDSVPVFASQFQERFYESPTYKSMMNELEAYERAIQFEHHKEAFKTAMDEEHQKRASKKSPYVASFYQQ
ncbi:hypothetical protein CU098_000798, partial [Rhizopus stolonifer]